MLTGLEILAMRVVSTSIVLGVTAAACAIGEAMSEKK